MSEPRRISIEDAVGIVDRGLVTRAITPEVRGAWDVLKGELLRRAPARAVETELQRGRELAGLEGQEP